MVPFPIAIAIPLTLPQRQTEKEGQVVWVCQNRRSELERPYNHRPLAMDNVIAIAIPLDPGILVSGYRNCDYLIHPNCPGYRGIAIAISHPLTSELPPYAWTSMGQWIVRIGTSLYH